MKSKDQPTAIDKDKIIEFYTDYCLSHGHAPHSVYQFAKMHEMPESEFYQYFASFQALEEAYFVNMFEFSLALLHQNEHYQSYDSASKLSAFYFTFFEMATANRSFVLYMLQKESYFLKSCIKLRSLRPFYQEYALTILEKPIKIEQGRAMQIQDKILQEASWLQFLSIFKFWMDDRSANFEKTDIFIEKSVQTSFDLAYNLPTKNLLDFGKFLWKEHRNKA